MKIGGFDTLVTLDTCYGGIGINKIYYNKISSKRSSKRSDYVYCIVTSVTSVTFSGFKEDLE